MGFLGFSRGRSMVWYNDSVGAIEMSSIFVEARAEKIVFIMEKVMLC